MTTQKSVLFLATRIASQKTGGVEMQIDRIAGQLRSRGWQISYIATAPSPADSPYDPHCEYVRRSRYFDLVRLDILRILRRRRPSLVYQRGRSNLTASLVGWIAANILRLPTVYHFAEDSDFDPNIFLPDHFHKSPWPIRLLMRCQNLLKRKLFDMTIRSAALRFAQTEWQRVRCEQTFHRNAELVRSPIEIPRHSASKDTPPVVLWIAHAGRRKRLEIFVRLAAALSHHRVRFVAAGTVPDASYRSEIDGLMRTTPNIVHVGPLSWDESQNWFARASIVVNTSLPDREGFPNTYLQAWIHATPVVTLDCDPDGLLETQQMGFHSRSFEQLIADVDRLIANPGLRAEMGARAREYVSAQHDANKIGLQIDSHFTHLLNAT